MAATQPLRWRRARTFSYQCAFCLTELILESFAVEAGSISAQVQQVPKLPTCGLLLLGVWLSRGSKDGSVLLESAVSPSETLPPLLAWPFAPSAAAQQRMIQCGSAAGSLGFRKLVSVQAPWISRPACNKCFFARQAAVEESRAADAVSSCSQATLRDNTLAFDMSDAAGSHKSFVSCIKKAPLRDSSQGA